ncbi:MAG: hypothetical protein ACKV2Q_24580 [Planctomycetaceae bacterium]
MDFLKTATDDQIALLGCFVALVTSAALMYVSVFLSRSNRKGKVREATQHTLTLTAREDRPVQKFETEKRKVA